MSEFVVRELVLIALYYKDDQPQKSIVEVIGSRKASVGPVMNDLEREGYVRSYQRRDTKSHPKMYSLTEKGRALANYPVRRAKYLGFPLNELPKFHNGKARAART